MSEASATADQSLASAPRAPAQKRGTRNRPATEAEILAAALRLLKRDGVLAGLNLREVAEEAGVNRGLIYQYYGSRAQLLREAILQLGWGAHPIFSVGQAQPFTERRHEIFAESLQRLDAIKLMALVALDESLNGLEKETLFPNIAETAKSVTRDQATGQMNPNVNGLAAHLMSVATYFGYATLRDTFARESGMTTEDLDKYAIEIYDLMLEGFLGEQQATTRNKQCGCGCTHSEPGSELPA